METKKLTRLQVRLFIALCEFYKNNGCSPTYRELSIMTGRCKSSICEMLHKIEEKGYIRIEDKTSRVITILKEEKYDRCIGNNKRNIEEKKVIQHGLSKKNKQNRGNIWR